MMSEMYYAPRCEMYYAPRCEIRVGNSLLAADITNQVTSVSYDNNMDMADMFSIALRNAHNQLLDSSLFDIGQNVEIYMGYGNNLRPMMWGEITAIQPSFPESGAPMLSISGYDKSYKLRHNQPDRQAYRAMTDSMIATQIALEAGLIPIVDSSSIWHQEIQQVGSDMSFLLERARMNFFRTYVHWDRLYFQAAPVQIMPYVLEWGKNLSSYSPRISSAALANLQVIRGYNEELAETIVGSAQATDLTFAMLTQKLGANANNLLRSLGRRASSDPRIDSQRDADQIAKSILQEVLAGLYEGSGSCIGQADMRAYDMISIQGIGRRFSGSYQLRRVTHTIDTSGYRTDFEVAQSGGTSLLPQLRKSLLDSPAPNQPERFYGVGVARVKNNVDAAQLGRVQLSYPWLSDTVQSGWARCTAPMAGADKGVYFLPEIDDEVLVAFEQGDFSSPVILGSLWNGKAQPPEKNADGLNNVRLIKTKSGHKILFDDSEDKERMLIEDKTGSQILLTSDGSVLISAKKDLKLQALNGSIELQSANGSLIFQATEEQKDLVMKNSGSQLALCSDGTINISAEKELTVQAGSGSDISLKAKNVQVKVTGTMDVS